MNSEENKVLIGNITGSFIVKGLSILISYLTIPAYMGFFHNQSILGVWFVLLGLLTWIINFDLGIGNGLRNKVALFLKKKDYDNAKILVSSSYMILFLLSCFIGFFGYLLIDLLDLNSVLNISNSIIPAYVLKQAVMYVYLGIVCYFVLKLISSILLSIEKVAIVNFLQLITSILNLLFLYIINNNSSVDAFLLLSKFYIFSLNIPYLIATVICFTFSRLKYIRPSIRLFDKSLAANVFYLGGQFFLIQLILLIINTTNEFLVTNIFGPKFVVEYQIYYKLFYLIVTLFSLITNPIWSNVTVAFNDKNFQRIKKIREKLFRISMIAILGVIVIIILFDPITKIWLGSSSITYNLIYGIIFGVYSVLMIFVLSETSIANGISRLRAQLFGLGIGALVKIPITYFLAHLFNNHWIIVVLVNDIILLFFVIIQKKDLDNFFLDNE